MKGKVNFVDIIQIFCTYKFSWVGWEFACTMLKSQLREFVLHFSFAVSSIVRKNIYLT